MPSFDIVSEVNMHEVKNSVDQANREVKGRYDFKGTSARLELDNNTITLYGENDYQLGQMLTMLRQRMGKRDIDIECLDAQNPELSGREARQILNIQQGISKELGKKIIKKIKDAKMKVQPSMHDDKVKVSGKKIDDLQEVISILKSSSFELPLQFNNFRD